MIDKWIASKKGSKKRKKEKKGVPVVHQAQIIVQDHRIMCYLMNNMQLEPKLLLLFLSIF